MCMFPISLALIAAAPAWCLLAWAVVSVILINRQDDKDPLPVVEASMPREILAIVASAGLYFGVVQAHGYLGYPVY